MGSGFFNNPPTNPTPDLPPIPDLEQLARQFSKGLKKGGFWDDLIAKFIHGSGELLVWVIGFCLSIFQELLSLCVHMLSLFQGINTPGFRELTASVISDLLAVEVSPDTINETWVHRGMTPGMQAVGKTLLDVLMEEMSLGQNLGTPNSTMNPATAFLGFLMSFAIREANLEFFADFFPEQIDLIHGLRAYGEKMAENLGLGRLARRALQPLVQVLVADPMLYYLNQQFRPKLVTYTECCEAYVRGFITREKLNEWMSWQGFSDEAIQVYVDYYSRKWTPIELIDLERRGEMDDQTAEALLQQAGMDAGTANRLLTAHKYQMALGIIHQQATAIISQNHMGLINVGTAISLINELFLTDVEKQAYADYLGTRVEHGFKNVTESEMERAYLGGIVDLTAMQTYWTSIGFKDPQIEILTLLLLQKQAGGNKTTSGHVPHKNLTEAELEKAYKAGIITLPALQAEWTALGYSANSITILTQLVGG